LIDIIEICDPKYLLIANSFNSISIGHFNAYKHNNDLINAKDMSRLFNNTLRDCGYIKVKTGLWNNRPSYWKKEIDK
jgi:hypothetical protein